MSNAPPPTSTPPAPPTSGGNGTYAILAIVLLLGIAGLLYWKFKGDGATAEVAQPTSSAAPTFHREEDMPPPPEPIPEAGAPEDAGKTDKVAAGGASSGCEAKGCSDAPSSALQGALAQRGRQARRCYESQLANDPTLSVKMSLNVKVGTNGSVCSASVADTTNDGISRCVLNFFRTGGFPPSKGCIANVSIPLNYVPR